MGENLKKIYHNINFNTCLSPYIQKSTRIMKKNKFHTCVKNSKWFYTCNIIVKLTIGEY